MNGNLHHLQHGHLRVTDSVGLHHPGKTARLRCAVRHAMRVRRVLKQSSGELIIGIFSRSQRVPARLITMSPEELLLQVHKTRSRTDTSPRAFGEAH